MSITERQKQILNYMRSYQAREGFPPAIREICKALGLVSPGSLIKHLQALEREGHLTKASGKKEGMEADRSILSIFYSLNWSDCRGHPHLGRPQQRG
jgi:SOS-response transcriptional repressor LexA